MTRPSRLGAHALAGVVALLAACSNARESGARAVDAGIDAAAVDAASIGDAARDASAGDEGEDADGDADVTCSGGCGGGTCTPTGCLVVLAQSSAPVDVAVDHDNAYFTSCSPGGDGGAAMRVPLDGGAAVTVAAGQACPFSLAVHGANLYVAGLQGADIAAVPTVGGTPTILVSSSDSPIGIAVDGASVYWTTSGGALMKVSVDGGTPEVLIAGQGTLTRPAVDAEFVYWGDSSGGTINKVPLDGGAVVTLTTIETVTAVTLGGTDVYIADGYSLAGVPIDGGPVIAVGNPTGAPVLAVAADDTSVYFASYSTIYRVARTGGQPTPLATNQGEPHALVVDDASVYWTNATRWPPELAGGPGQVVKLTPK